MDVQFNEADHSYTIDGISVPGVTSVLEPLYDFRFVKEEDLIRARENGKKVHKTVELGDQDRLNLETLHPFLRAHLDAWNMFKRDFKFRPRLHEVVLATKRWGGCAGTADTVGDMELQNGTLEPWVIDVKTGSPYPAHRLQTAGYKRLGMDMGLLSDSTKRASLYLSEEGYDIKFHDNALDEAAFLSLLTVAHWRKHNVR